MVKLKSRSSTYHVPHVRRITASRQAPPLRRFGRGPSGYTLTTSADESVVRTREPSAGAAWSIAVGDDDEVTAGGSVTG